MRGDYSVTWNAKQELLMNFSASRTKSRVTTWRHPSQSWTRDSLETCSSLRFVGHPELKGDLGRDLRKGFGKESPISRRHSTGALARPIFIIKDNHVTLTSPLHTPKGSRRSPWNAPQLSPLSRVQFAGLNRAGRFPLISPLPSPNP